FTSSIAIGGSARQVKGARVGVNLGHETEALGCLEGIAEPVDAVASLAELRAGLFALVERVACLDARQAEDRALDLCRADRVDDGDAAFRERERLTGAAAVERDPGQDRECLGGDDAARLEDTARVALRIIQLSGETLRLGE